jgi:hypothetical protein
MRLYHGTNGAHCTHMWKWGCPFQIHDYLLIRDILMDIRCILNALGNFSWNELAKFCPKQIHWYYIYTSGYPWPSDTVKSPGFFKPRQTHKGVKQLVLFLFYLFFVKKIRWKVPHENIHGEASILENFQKKN